MKRLSVIVALLIALAGAQAQGPDDQYISIYTLIQDADKLNTSEQPAEALAKYREAQTELERFKKGYPEWNPKVISFRLSYVAGKIAEVSPKVRAAAIPTPGAAATNQVAPPTTAPPLAAKPAPGDWESRLAGLTEQVRQLQSDKTLLEAKLKEALSVQPAAVDPRELVRAEEKIKNLQKENDLLKVSLDQEKAKPAPMSDMKTLDETRLALAEANRKLAEQTKATDALAQEKTALQTKLHNLTPSPANATELETTRKALQDANQKLAEQAKLASDWTVEKEALQSRVKTLAANADAATALQAENQLLKKQLADLKAPAPATEKTDDASRQLAQARAQIASLQSDKEMLLLEKSALENRIKQSPAPAVTEAPAPAPIKPGEEGRVKQLERERDDLQKQLKTANKELYSRKGKAAAARLADLQNQLTTLRARLDVYEARQLPYTPEELALFKQPEAKPAEPEPKATKKSVKELPPGTAALVTEARRYYANKQFDKAEQTYQQAVQQDNKSVPTLANLANIQVDLDHLDAAETNLKQATALAPDDPYSLFVLGRLRFRQKKYDEAIEALSRAAKLDPQDAQTENLLGLALSEKGLRGPAETALRKAIQLDPNYADAHNNLAVVYITQQPPLVELARWHYQKALAAGNPRNPSLEKMLDAKQAAESGK